MVSVPVQCPHCQSTEVIKAGKQAKGTQRYQCQNGQCGRFRCNLQNQDKGAPIRHAAQAASTVSHTCGVRAWGAQIAEMSNWLFLIWWTNAIPLIVRAA